MAEYDSLAAQLHDPSHFLGAVEGDAVYSSVFIRGDKDHLSDEKVPHQFLSAIEKNNASFTQKSINFVFIKSFCIINNIVNQILLYHKYRSLANIQNDKIDNTF